MTQSARFINRELSWLEFNQRVLDEASSPGMPVLERLRFLAITASNLDEFFMVRVGGLVMLSGQDAARRDPAGLTAHEQLAAITRRTRTMVKQQYDLYQQELEPGLRESGIRQLRPADLSEPQTALVDRVVENELCAILTPIAVESDAQFPLLSDRTLHVCVRLEPDAKSEGRSRFAVITLGRAVDRFLTLPTKKGYEFILLENAIAMGSGRLFPGESVVECVPFRLTRNADLAVRDDLAPYLLALMETMLDARKRSACVRLEIAARASRETRRFLQRGLGAAPEAIYDLDGPLDFSAFMKLTSLRGFDALRYEPWPPVPSPAVDPAKPMFDVVAGGDVLLHHPYESFEPVVRLLQEAANDPDVVAIKQILYRTSRDSPIVEALRTAAQNGKQVTVIVELKARFDEGRNIQWARSFEKTDTQVIYGVKGLKTHAKVCIIMRREPHGIRRYVHFGTGNYNEVTARLYSDVSLITCDEQLGADASRFFNAITGYSQPQKYEKLAAAPLGLREKICEMIEIETDLKRRGRKAEIVAQLNSIADPDIIEALYKASQAGVTIKLNVRGICCLRPGVEDLSENISVVSVVDRFLEHARILYFHHGGDRRVFISSADWMPRNLDQRVELLIPVEHPAHRERLIAVMQSYANDAVKGRRLRGDGSYWRPEATRGRRHRSQEALYAAATQAHREAQQSQRTVFEPHRAPQMRAVRR